MQGNRSSFFWLGSFLVGKVDTLRSPGVSSRDWSNSNGTPFPTKQTDRLTTETVSRVSSIHDEILDEQTHPTGSGDGTRLLIVSEPMLDRVFGPVEMNAEVCGCDMVLSRLRSDFERGYLE